MSVIIFIFGVAVGTILAEPIITVVLFIYESIVDLMEKSS